MTPLKVKRVRDFHSRLKWMRKTIDATIHTLFFTFFSNLIYYTSTRVRVMEYEVHGEHGINSNIVHLEQF